MNFVLANVFCMTNDVLTSPLVDNRTIYYLVVYSYSGFLCSLVHGESRHDVILYHYELERFTTFSLCLY